MMATTIMTKLNQLEQKRARQNAALEITEAELDLWNQQLENIQPQKKGPGKPPDPK